MSARCLEIGTRTPHGTPSWGLGAHATWGTETYAICTSYRPTFVTVSSVPPRERFIHARNVWRTRIYPLRTAPGRSWASALICSCYLYHNTRLDWNDRRSRTRACTALVHSSSHKRGRTHRWPAHISVSPFRHNAKRAISDRTYQRADACMRMLADLRSVPRMLSTRSAPWPGTGHALPCPMALAILGGRMAARRAHSPRYAPLPRPRTLQAAWCAL